MLKIINTKILVAILVADAALGAVLVHISNNTARSAKILQQQQAAAEAARKHDEETKEFIEAQHKKHSAYTTNGSQTLSHYLP